MRYITVMIRCSLSDVSCFAGYPGGVKPPKYGEEILVTIIFTWSCEISQLCRLLSSPAANNIIMQPTLGISVVSVSVGDIYESFIQFDFVLSLTGVSGEGLPAPRATLDSTGSGVPDGSVVGVPGGTGGPLKPGEPFSTFSYFIR